VVEAITPKGAELIDEDVIEPEESEEVQQSLHWNEFARMVRALNSAYPNVDPLDLSMTKLFKMILQLPGFDDNPDAVGEEYLEKLQMAWHEVRTG
jgi:FeS assembly protein IscX